MTTVTLIPRDAIREVLARRAATTRSIAAALIADGYRWPTRSPDAYPYASVERVHSTLQRMEREGLVTRWDGGPHGAVWRLGDVGERADAALARVWERETAA